ncbi:PPOX class F420-dependent oxidoreductase [Streptomyces sp. NBC_00344]|uniref:PPOX class F420-dependent oxidoreductase n=1 Tax=Streptomyces sp. NBC_00344 TaxID=2975720 RepID=UPI002E1CD7F9
MTPSPPSPATGPLAPLAKQKAILLTTRKRDGTTVGTPVSIAVEGDHAYIRTYSSAWKVKRMRNFPEVEIAPSTMRGKRTGPVVRARVRLLDPGSAENTHAAQVIARKYPIVHGALVPFAHRLKRERTLHYEVRALDT